MYCEVCCCKHATWTCQFYVVPAAVSNLQWRAAEAIRRQRHAALLGKARLRLGALELGFGLRGPSTPNLTLVAELIEPYLVLLHSGLVLALGGHRLLAAAAHWPCAGLALVSGSGPVQAVTALALLIWPWAGHAAYRS